MRGEPVPFQFNKSPCVRIHLLAGSRQPLDGQFLQALAEPIQSWGCARIFKRKNQIDPLLVRGGRTRAWRRSSLLCGNRSGSKNDSDGE